MKIQLLALTTGIFLAANSHAYLAELQLATDTQTFNVDYDGAFNGETRNLDQLNTQLQGTIYFKPITPASSEPLAEAAFLSKAGYVNVSFASADVDYEKKYLGTRTKFSSNLNNNSIAIHGVAGKVIIEGEYTGAKENYEKSAIPDIKAQTARFGLGGYLGNHSTIVVSLLKNKIEQEPYYAPQKETAINKGINTDLKFFIPLSGEQSLSLGGYIALFKSELDDIHTNADGGRAKLNIFTDYYLTPKVALQFAYNGDSFVGSESYTDMDVTRITRTFSLGSEYFIINNLSIFGKLQTTFGEYDHGDYSADVSGNGFSIGIKGRI